MDRLDAGLRKVHRWQERNFLRLDWIMPAGVACLAVAYLEWGGHRPEVISALDNTRATAYAGIAAVAGSLLGFTLTLILITQAILGLDALRPVRDSKYSAQLFDAYLHTALAFGVLTIFALVALISDTDTHPKVGLTYLTLLLGGVSVWKFARAFNLTWKVVRLAAG